MNLLKPLILFLIGGFTYYGIEIMWRGYSHISMMILGGLAFLLIGFINTYLSWETPLWKQCGIATVIVLVLEFICGCIVNLWLHLNIWDYSQLPLNLYGQICLQYAFAWYGLSLIAIILDDVIRWLLFGENKPKYKLF